MAKGKSIQHQCAHCERITKMEVIGAGEGQAEKTWYRCTRCRHATLIDLTALKRVEEQTSRKLEKAECSEYTPLQTYTVGQAIFHSEWDDVGKIVSKQKTSGGASAIVVSFERLGERRLLENVVQDVEA
jgi:DNA-directed RNA polymerase subunit RPC12/RpoP